MKVRPGFHDIAFEWDSNSTSAKPLSPPTAVLITGLSPLTTSDQISKFLRPHGRIKELQLKTDTKSGMQLGICWVRFDGPAQGKKGTAHEVAKHVIKMCDGKKVGLHDEKIKVVLDGRKKRMDKAVKEEMERRYPPKKKPVAAAAAAGSTAGSGAAGTMAAPGSAPSTVTATPTPLAQTAPTPLGGRSASGAANTPAAGSETPHPSAPTGLTPAKQMFTAAKRYRPPTIIFHNNAPTSLPPSRSYPGAAAGGSVPPPWAGSGAARTLSGAGGRYLPESPVQQLESSFTEAPFARRAQGGYAYDRAGGAGYDLDREISRGRRRSLAPGADTYIPRASRSPSYDSLDSYSSYDSGSDDGRRRRAGAGGREGGRSPYGRRRAGAAGPTKEDEQAVERVKEAVKANGHAHVFIDAKYFPARAENEGYLRDHFKVFKPTQVLHNHTGWYILFGDDHAGHRARMLDTTMVQGHRLVVNVHVPPSASARPMPESPTTATKEKGNWRLLTIAKKNRPVPAVKPKEKEEREEKRGKIKGKRSRMYSSEEDSSDEDVSQAKPKKKAPTYSSSSLSDAEDEVVSSLLKPVAVKHGKEEEGEKDEEDVDMDMESEEEGTGVKAAPAVKDEMVLKKPEDNEPAAKTKGGKPKAKKAPTAANAVVEAKGKKRPAKAKESKAAKKARLASPVVAIPSDANTDSATPEVSEIKLDGTAVQAPKKKSPRTELDKLIAGGTLEDDADAYWLSRALAAAEDGVEPVFSDDEDEPPEEDHPLYHTSGAWRAEGWKKIPQVQKSKYLPQRNRAAKNAEDAGGVTTGRTARLAGRDQHRQTAAVAAHVTIESDLFAFNQLRIRKKQLRFARSAIEGYGLYAMETIHMGEMVCEYVGDLCRATVADVREQRYLKQGIGSSYLFRIDNDTVCDATFKGSVSRLINHSCDPSANAKIIKVNGQSKIVIYAERTLYPGEEILYDYKFPLESDPALRVPCLCGAATCRGWLN